MDEEIQTENESVETAPTDTESSTVEEQTTHTEEVTQDDQASETETETEGSQNEANGNERRKNAQSRIKELLDENRQLKSQAGDQYAQSPIGSGKFSELFANANSVTPDDLDAAAERYAAQTANTLVDLKLAPVLQELQQERLATDIDRVQSKYDVLNPDSDNYDARLDKQIAELYSKYGSSGRLSDFVDEQMALASATADKQTARSNETVRQQIDDQAMRPSSPRSETPFEELSEAEMEKRLGIIR